MTLPNNPAAETAQPHSVGEALGKTVTDTTTITASGTTPASEPPVEEWDKDRAMDTIKKLREIEKQAKQDAKEFQRLKADEQKRKDDLLSETERLQKQANDATAQIATLKADILRRDVVAETGLPAIFADRLKGTTKEEMIADAQEILKVLPQQPQPKTPPRVPATNPANGNPNETEAQQRERLFGKSGNIFEIGAIREGGGGVVWNTPPEK